MKRYPNVSVSIILRYKNKMLILKHLNGVFNFPGGRMKWGESIFGALNRELKEELNYSLDSLKSEPELFGVWNYISKNRKNHRVYINYIHQLNEKPNFSSPENIKTLWLTKENAVPIIKDKKFIEKIFQWPNQKNFTSI